MLFTRTTRTAAALLVATTLWGAIPGEAAGPAAAVSTAASGGAPALNVTATGDLVSVYNFGPLQQGVIDAATAAAGEAGGVGVLGRGFGIGLVQVTRGAAVVHQAPGPLGSWYFPMSVTALPIDSIGVAMGRDVSDDHQPEPGGDGRHFGQLSSAPKQATYCTSMRVTVRSPSSSSAALLPTRRSVARRS